MSEMIDHGVAHAAHHPAPNHAQLREPMALLDIVQNVRCRVGGLPMYWPKDGAALSNSDAPRHLPLVDGIHRLFAANMRLNTCYITDSLVV